ncbi:50S ribosomal protein L17 [Patescibacteria group bacterium]
MRHGNSIRKFGRVKRQREALLKSLAVSLILNDKIRTTEAKAKELRPFIEKMITKGKGGSIAMRRLVDSRLGGNEIATKKLIDELSKKYEDRDGGYTRITKLAYMRAGDGSKLAQIEFV